MTSGSRRLLLRVGVLLMLVSVTIPVDAQVPGFVSPFERHDTPPPGIPAQLDVASSVACPAGSPAGASMTALQPIAESGTDFLICIAGFAAGTDVDVSTLRPDGTTRKSILTTDSGGSAQLRWAALPEDPVGTYSVTAAQGGLLASVEFGIVPAAQAHMTVTPAAGGPSTTFRLAGSGLPPGREVALSVYRQSGAFWQYLSSFTSIQADDTGQTPTYGGLIYGGEGGIPEGTYLIRANESGASAQFQVYSGVNGAVAAAAPSAGLLKRRDVPPGATAAQMYFGQGAGSQPSCEIKEDSELRQQPVDARWCALKWGDDLGLVFEGFAPNRDLSIRITGPDGAVRVHQLRADDTDVSVGITIRGPRQFFPPTGFNEDPAPLQPGEYQFALALDWDVHTLSPNDPVGLYSVDVTQGVLRGSGTFSVSPADAPRLRLLTSGYPDPFLTNISPGDPVEVLLVGITPGQRVPLGLYYAPPGGVFAEYVTSVDPGPADAAGTVRVAIPTQSDDPPGMYSIESPIVQTFWVERTFDLGRSSRDTPLEQRPLGNMVYATIGESDRVWADTISRAGRPTGDLAAFYGGTWLDYVSGLVDQMRATGRYRVAQLTALQLNNLSALPDGSLEALATETWDDQEFADGGVMTRDLSGTLDQRYVFQRAADRWLIVDSQIVRN